VLEAGTKLQFHEMQFHFTNSYEFLSGPLHHEMVHWNVARVVRARMLEARLWAASVVAAVGFCGAGFMLWFLIALLREGAPRSATGLYPSAEKRERRFTCCRVRYDGGDCCGRHAGSKYRVDLLENEIMRGQGWFKFYYSGRAYHFWRAGLARKSNPHGARPPGNAASSEANRTTEMRDE